MLASQPVVVVVIYFIRFDSPNVVHCNESNHVPRPRVAALGSAVAGDTLHSCCPSLTPPLQQNFRQGQFDLADVDYADFSDNALESLEVGTERETFD